jgi:hypothetical protein
VADHGGIRREVRPLAFVDSYCRPTRITRSEPNPGRAARGSVFPRKATCQAPGLTPNTVVGMALAGGGTRARPSDLFNRTNVLLKDAIWQKAPLTPRQPYGVTLAFHPNAPERKTAARTESTNWGPVLGLRSFY